MVRLGKRFGWNPREDARRERICKRAEGEYLLARAAVMSNRVLAARMERKAARLIGRSA